MSLVENLLANALWGAVFLVSGTISATSGACAVALNYGSDVVTAIKLALGIEKPIAPEAHGVTDKQWELLASDDAPHYLREYARFGCDDDLRLPAFLEAAKVLTLASTLSYATEADANQLLDKQAASWTAKLVESETKRAQVMLLMTTANDRNKSPSTGSAAASPIVVLAFRGTELPDDDKEGLREFFPDWWRNLYFVPKPVPGRGKVAKGFFEAWNGSPDDVKVLKTEALRTIHKFSDTCGDKTVDLFVTGHSGGGALAHVSLLDLLQLQRDGDTSFKLRGCMTLAQPRFCDKEYADNVIHGMKHIPLDLIANEDVTGVDPVVALGGPWTTVPPGRFWKVRVDQVFAGPSTCCAHVRTAQPPLLVLARRLAMSLPLHWTGGRVGYLAALCSG